MVLDAPSSNGPFQPVALMHFRGENRKFASSACSVFLCFQGGNEQKIVAIYFGILHKRIIVSEDFSKSCCERVRAFTLLVLVAGVFLEEEAGDCVCMSMRKGSAKTVHS